MQKDLFVLLMNRAVKENQYIPTFIGKFDGINDLPRGEYPATYFWIDVMGGGFRLSFNDPLLERWCLEEANTFGLNMNNTKIKNAIELFHNLSISVFQDTINKA